MMFAECSVPGTSLFWVTGMAGVIRYPGKHKTSLIKHPGGGSSPEKNVLRLLGSGGLRACDGFTQSELKELKLPDCWR